MITLNGLGKQYQDESGEIWPVREIDLEINDGRFVSIVGRSGSGKSTLLKMMGCLLTPTEGTVRINNIDIYSLNEKQQAEYRCKTVGFVFQDYFLEELYTVYQNIEIVLMIANTNPKTRKEKIESALEKVGLLHKKDSYVKNLSGGEKQRVCIARAIVNDPEIIFADEPCGNLDWENGQVIMKLLRGQVDEGKTVVLVTHNIDDANMTDEIVTMKDGKIIQHAIKR